MKAGSLLYKLHEWFDNSLNPITIKELSQIVRGKFLSVILLLFLGFQLLVVMMSLKELGDSTRGGEYFIAFMTLVLLCGTLVIAIYNGHRFSEEYSSFDSDLLFITTLTPQSIIRGKFLTAFLIVVLFYSTSLPYMTFAYFLPGVDLPSVFAIIVLCLIFAALSTALFLFLACIALPRALVIGLKIIALCVSVGLLSGFQNVCYELQMAGVYSYLEHLDFWNFLIPCLLFFIFCLGMLYLFSVASLTPSSADKAYYPRLFATICWVLSLIDICVCRYWGSKRLYDGLVYLWYICTNCFLMIAFVIAIHERSWWGRRVAFTIPRDFLKRCFAFLFYSGSAGGLVWSMLLLAMTRGAYTLLGSGSSSSGGFPPCADTIPALEYYICGYILLSEWLRRNFFAKWIPKHYTLAVAGVIIALGTLVHSIVGHFFVGAFPNEWGVGDPLFYKFAVGEWNASTEKVTAVFAGISLMLNLPWLKRQWERFRPIDEIAPDFAKDAE